MVFSFSSVSVVTLLHPGGPVFAVPQAVQSLCQEVPRCRDVMKLWSGEATRDDIRGAIQSGPLPVVSRVVTPLIGLITPVTHLFRTFITI